MEKFQIEYNMSVSPRMLFNRLSTATGLAEWFADEVYVNDKVFTFIWNGSEQKAEIIRKKNNDMVRFKWLDGDQKDNYFEFRLQEDELTGELALIITDFADQDEIQDAKDLWNSQVSELKHNLGI